MEFIIFLFYKNLSKIDYLISWQTLVDKNLNISSTYLFGVDHDGIDAKLGRFNFLTTFDIISSYLYSHTFGRLPSIFFHQTPMK